MEEMNRKAQTPEETEQAVALQAKRLEEMEKAEGVFGEAISYEEMEDVAGGWNTPPSMGDQNTSNNDYATDEMTR